ncbi:FkbM family methyltransferase [Actinomadura geliboluensis]|uniref:FkbM family methyltransferase n=1 Tax=Actinomadura geliboluensis TaxID=882440 RepID=UPI0036ABBD45
MQLALPDQEQYAAPTGAYLVVGSEGLVTRPAGTAVIVPTRPMSELVDGVELVKLDIEGHEAEVLEAVRPCLLEQCPTIVVDVPKNVPRLRKLICELRDASYEVCAIGSEGLQVSTNEELRADMPLPRYGSRDVILVPAERSGAL